MNKAFKFIVIIIVLITIVVGVQFFISNKKIENLNHAKIDTIAIKDNRKYIIENLDNPNVLKEFPDQNFPDKKEIQKLIADISEKCDWKKREGGLIDSYTTKNIDGIDQIAYIYKFKLACGPLNFIMTYNMDKEKFQLFRFDFEPLPD